ncbi:unnamed protein product [Cylindrotheca closterium]|uniref:Uncharacterized protein n=1 Tax=Cylindrotheca closterium TaxID=2856 RepID=A0AAD2G5C3_9STRA|nr:unnamed protein product [Cylindrotheca closterium]
MNIGCDQDSDTMSGGAFPLISRKAMIKFKFISLSSWYLEKALYQRFPEGGGRSSCLWLIAPRSSSKSNFQVTWNRVGTSS